MLQTNHILTAVGWRAVGVPNIRAPGLRRLCAIWDGSERRCCDCWGEGAPAVGAEPYERLLPQSEELLYIRQIGCLAIGWQTVDEHSSIALLEYPIIEQSQ